MLDHGFVADFVFDVDAAVLKSNASLASATQKLK